MMEQTNGATNIRYKNMQCIGLSMCTTPGNLTSIEGMSDDGVYLGRPTIKEDIQARFDFLHTVLEEYILSKSIAGSDTLKVFMIPEFFFRGCSGAYLDSEHAASVFFEHYFSDFLNYVRRTEKLNDWLIVLGSVLTTTQTLNNSAPQYGTGDNLLNLYYRLYPKGANGQQAQGVPSLHDFLKSIDEMEAGDTQDRCLKTEDLAFQDVLRCTLDYCDSVAETVIDNSCYVVVGGKLQTGESQFYRIQKQYKSKEDFVLNTLHSGKATGYVQSESKYPIIPSKGEVKKEYDDPYAIFSFRGISLGVEICLDHSRKRLLTYYLNCKSIGGKHVDVQLIPSCGMEIRPNAVMAKKGGWVFNCDGEYAPKEESNNFLSSHTSLRQVVSPIESVNNSATLGHNLGLSKLSEDHDIPKAYSDLFPEKRFATHVYDPVLLSADNNGEEGAL